MLGASAGKEGWEGSYPAEPSHTHTVSVWLEERLCLSLQLWVAQESGAFSAMKSSKCPAPQLSPTYLVVPV